MTEMNDHQLRQAFFDLFAIKSNQNAVRKWAQNRVRYLEQQIEALEAHLRKRNATIDELEYEIKTYQTAVSQKTGSTSQESEEERHQANHEKTMGDDMTETSDDELRQRFFELILSNTSQNEILWWAQNRVRGLEQQIKAMEAHPQERNATIDELEDEITFQESDEERHQRHRRERMLDEVTLICVRSEIASVSSSATDERRCGRMSRDSAENICDGIDKFDAKQ